MLSAVPRGAHAKETHMLRFILKVLINAAALWVAGTLVGATIPVDSLNAPMADVMDLVVIALIFGFLNVLVRPVLAFAQYRPPIS